MTATIPYEVTFKAGDIEFRKYSALVLATVDTMGDDNSGFSPLFAYISGKNTANNAIPMTSPVISSTKIPMTSPVVSDATTMSFVMPAGKGLNEIPEPLDSKVRIIPVPEREVAVLRFKGKTRDKDVKEKEGLLRKALKDAGITPVGDVFLMRYNPPWTPGFLRRNELGLEIER
ncbi:MAG TPA: heme-binding protein [Methanocorpusculum sp.]|nr:heme-binding protein [Methanocorpusculum sp.]HKL97045.1 heme-binding protein [Methanocorpusculum sp.]